MIFDATTAESALLERRFDACVIGAGPAGITLARRLAAQGFAVALMEAGGLELTRGLPGPLPGRGDRARLLSARRGAAALLRRHLEPLGRLVPRARRLRLPPAPVPRLQRLADREVRPRPLPAEADAILDLPPPAGLADLPITQAGDDFRHVLFRFSRPATRFGEKYRARSKPPTASASSSTPTSSTCASATDPGGVERGGLRHLSAGDAAVLRRGPGLLPLHRRAREPPAAAQLHEPDAAGHRQPERPGRPVLLRASALRAGRPAARGAPATSKEFYAPTEAFMDAHAGAELRAQARAGPAAAAALLPPGVAPERGLRHLLHRGAGRAGVRPRARLRQGGRRASTSRGCSPRSR